MTTISKFYIECCKAACKIADLAHRVNFDHLTDSGVDLEKVKDVMKQVKTIERVCGKYNISASRLVRYGNWEVTYENVFNCLTDCAVLEDGKLAVHPTEVDNGEFAELAADAMVNESEEY